MLLLEQSILRMPSKNEQTQTIRFTMDLSSQWIDPLLKWDPSLANFTSLKVPEQSVWTPDITLFAATSNEDLIEYERRMVVLKHDGSILQSNPQVVTHPCQIDVVDFPYDTQTCRLDLGSWQYDTTYMRIETPYENYEPSDEFTGNNEWKLLSLSSELTLDTTYEEGDFQVLVFSVRLRRNSQFYSMAIVIPTCVCTFLCINGLFLPSETSGLNIEKVSLGVCTLLAMSLILESVTATMPRSQKLPLLGIYVLAETILCAIAVLITSIYLTLHERATTRGWNPPSCLVTTILTRQYDRKITHYDGFQQDRNGFESTQLATYLEVISSFLREVASDSRLERMWARIFDRINVLTLIFFQFINIVLTLAILL
ncbi:Neurotransmitter-gated ion-channel ligand binding domain protein [Cooperia oncophora]